METRIVIEWDGPVGSLAHHRMSIGMWNDALDKLLKAVRRTASTILTQREQASATGRYAEDATFIDVEIFGIEDGCTRVSAVVTTSNPDLFRTLPAQAAERLVRDLEKEARGQMVNPAARAYLRAVPSIVTKQEYTVWYNGQMMAQTTLGERREDDPVINLPRTYRSQAVVTAVSFLPLGVTLRFPIGKVSASATREQVDYAVANHDGEITASVVAVDGKYRLVGIGRETALPLSPEARLVRVAADWSETLARLAK